jgi:hypothetical protein
MAQMQSGHAGCRQQHHNENTIFCKWITTAVFNVVYVMTAAKPEDPLQLLINALAGKGFHLIIFPRRHAGCWREPLPFTWLRTTWRRSLNVALIPAWTVHRASCLWWRIRACAGAVFQYIGVTPGVN